MTLVLIAVGIAALFFSIRRKSWFIALGLSVLLSSAVIITSIIQIQIMLVLGFFMLSFVVWIKYTNRHPASLARLRAIRFFRADKNTEIETEQADDSVSKHDQQKKEWQKQTNKKKYPLYIALLIIFVSLLVPAFLYTKEFGIDGWQQYQYWIEMGNSLAGVYAIIITLLVFLFLVAQVMLRSKKQALEYDQTLINDSKHDVEFYLAELDNYLNQWVDDTQNLNVLLYTSCGTLSEKKLANKRVQEQLAEFANCYPKLLDIWRPLVQILEKLSLPACYPYQYNAQSCIQKTASILSLQTCVALDKLNFGLSLHYDATDLALNPNSPRYFWVKENNDNK